jgi:hypothetical protein
MVPVSEPNDQPGRSAGSPAESGEGGVGLSSWLIIDCASKTTAVLVQEIDGRVSLLARGEARTTLDPEGDVTLGVLQAVAQVEEASEGCFVPPVPAPG